MAGLLGSAIAGAIGGYANNKVAQMDNQQAYDLKKALIDAEYEKNLMLKKAGIEMQQKADQQKMDQRAGYFKDVEESTTTPESVMNKYTDENGNEVVAKAGGETVTKTRPATFQDASERAFKAGDFEAGEGLLKVGAKKEKTFDSIKLDDGSVFSFDKSTGQGSIIFAGNKQVKIPKDETEIIWRAANGDPEAKKAAEMIITQKSRIAAAGRAPTKASDDDEAYADWKKKPENKGKGRDDYAKEKAGWGKANKHVSRTTGVDEFGDTVDKTTESWYEPISNENKTPAQPKPKVGRYVPGKGLVYD